MGVFTTVGGGEVITVIKEVVEKSSLPTGASGSIAVTITRLPLRPGEFDLSLGLGNEDFSIFEDILDNNIDIPHVAIESSEQDMHLRSGLFSLDYRVTHDRARALVDSQGVRHD